MDDNNVFKEKLIKLIKQFLGFGIVGLSNTIISLLVYYIFVYFGFHYLIANTAGFLVSVVNSYFWNSRYVFKDKAESNELHAFIKVVMSYGISFVLSSILLAVFVQIFGISEYIAPILKIAATVPLNFIMNKLWAFKDK